MAYHIVRQELAVVELGGLGMDAAQRAVVAVGGGGVSAVGGVVVGIEGLGQFASP